MALNELANLPINVKLNGKDYKIQRLSIKDIWCMADNKVIQDYYSSVQSISSVLPLDEKVKYLKEATKGVPKGNELFDARNEFLSSVDGISALLKMAISKYQEITDEELVEIIIKDSESIEFVLNYLMGLENKEDVKASTDIPDGKKK